MDDAEIIRRVLAGRRDDYATLVERHQRALHGYVRRMLGDPDAADDVVQAAFVQGYLRLAQFRGEASFRSWIHEIAIREMRARWRWRRSRPEVPLGDVPEAALAAAGDDPPARADLERLVARLPPRQRSVLSLRIFGDLPFHEIARIEGVTGNAAKVSYHHAVRKLKEWLG